MSSLGSPDDFPIFPCDVTDDASIEALFRNIAGRWKGLDALAHCIAYADRDDLNRPFSQISRRGLQAGDGDQRLLPERGLRAPPRR